MDSEQDDISLPENPQIVTKIEIMDSKDVLFDQYIQEETFDFVLPVHSDSCSDKNDSNSNDTDLGSRCTTDDNTNDSCGDPNNAHIVPLSVIALFDARSKHDSIQNNLVKVDKSVTNCNEKIKNPSKDDEFGCAKNESKNMDTDICRNMVTNTSINVNVTQSDISDTNVLITEIENHIETISIPSETGDVLPQKSCNSSVQDSLSQICIDLSENVDSLPRKITDSSEIRDLLPQKITNSCQIRDLLLQRKSDLSVKNLTDSSVEKRNSFNNSKTSAVCVKSKDMPPEITEVSTSISNQRSAVFFTVPVTTSVKCLTKFTRPINSSNNGRRGLIPVPTKEINEKSVTLEGSKPVTPMLKVISMSNTHTSSITTLSNSQTEMSDKSEYDTAKSMPLGSSNSTSLPKKNLDANLSMGYWFPKRIQVPNNKSTMNPIGANSSSMSHVRETLVESDVNAKENNPVDRTQNVNFASSNQKVNDVNSSNCILQSQKTLVNAKTQLIRISVQSQMPVYRPPSWYKGPVYQCNECKDSFISKETLRRHKDRRSVLFTYTCPVCCVLYQFYNRCAFLTHIKLHNVPVKSCNLSICTIPANLLNFNLVDRADTSENVTDIGFEDNEVKEEGEEATEMSNVVDKSRPFVDITAESDFQIKTQNTNKKASSSSIELQNFSNSINNESVDQNNYAKTIDKNKKGVVDSDANKYENSVKHQSELSNFSFTKNTGNIVDNNSYARGDGTSRKYEAVSEMEKNEKHSLNRSLHDKAVAVYPDVTIELNTDGPKNSELKRILVSSNRSKSKILNEELINLDPKNYFEKLSSMDTSRSNDLEMSKNVSSIDRNKDADEISEPICNKRPMPHFNNSYDSTLLPVDTIEEIVSSDENCNSELECTENVERHTNGDTMVSKASRKNICQECKKEVDDLVKHYRGKGMPKIELKCKVCSYLNPSSCSLSAHMRIHNKKHPYICPECAFLFIDITQFYAHIIKSCYYTSKTVRYFCNLCKCLKGSTSAFINHIKVNHIRTLYKCDLCCVSTYAEKILNMHAQRGHRNVKATYRSGYGCLLCPEVFIPELALDAHLFKHTLDLMYVYLCPSCKTFTTRDIKIFSIHISTCVGQDATKLGFVTLISDPEMSGMFKNMDCLNIIDLTEVSEIRDISWEQHENYGTNEQQNITLENQSKENNVTLEKQSKENSITREKRNNETVLGKEISKNVSGKGTLELTTEKEFNKKVSESDAVEIIPEKDPLKIEDWETDKLKKQNVRKSKSCLMCQLNNVNPDSTSLFCSKCVKCLDSDEKNGLSESVAETRLKRRYKCRLCKELMNREWVTIRTHYEEKHQSDFNPSSKNVYGKLFFFDSDEDDIKSGSAKKRKSALKSDVPLKMVKTEDKHGIQFQKRPDNYVCIKCCYITKSVSQFRSHIEIHKSANDFQCLECGECFIVRPTLEKHLIMLHGVKNTKEYFTQNNIKNEQEDITKNVEENQCEVCFLKCDSKASFDKHIRIHGMAFVNLHSRSRDMSNILKSSVKKDHYGDGLL